MSFKYEYGWCRQYKFLSSELARTTHFQKLGRSGETQGDVWWLWWGRRLCHHPLWFGGNLSTWLFRFLVHIIYLSSLSENGVKTCVWVSSSAPTTGSSLHHREWKHLVVITQLRQSRERASQHYKGELAENTEISPLGQERENHFQTYEKLAIPGPILTQIFTFWSKKK